jgi:hypothetical protein
MRNLTVVDIRRMNVALTRARASLFDRGTVLERSDRTWKDIISDARGVLVCYHAWKCTYSPLQSDMGFFTGPKTRHPLLSHLPSLRRRRLSTLILSQMHLHLFPHAALSCRFQHPHIVLSPPLRNPPLHLCHLGLVPVRKPSFTQPLLHPWGAH